MDRTRAAAIVCLLGATLLAGCSKVDEQLLLPWFKVRISRSPRIGGLADPVQRTAYFVKPSGLLGQFFWRQIGDTGVGSARVLNATTVAYYDSGVARLIHEGDSEAMFVCGRGPVGASFPAGVEAVDCVEVLAGPGRAVTSLRFRRVGASAAVLYERTITADGPSRRFLQPMVTFYDDGATPYLVTMNQDSAAAPDCALVAVGRDEVTLTAGPSSMRARDCSEASSWTPLLGRAIRRRDP